VLAFVGEVLRRHLREGDLAVRMGGEEFAVLLQGMHPSAAQAVAERLRCDLEHLAAQGAGLPITASLGVALATPGIDFAALWSQADGALYRAKTLGRNRVECTRSTGGHTMMPTAWAFLDPRGMGITLSLSAALLALALVISHRALGRGCRACSPLPGACCWPRWVLH
jgi:hypothetical protein